MEATNKDGTMANTNGETVRDAVVDMKNKATDTAKRIVSNLGDASKETLKTYADEGKKQLANLEDYVKQYPVRSVLIGVAAGMFLNRIFKN